MSYEAKGILHKKFDTEKKTETFQAREFVIKIEEGNYSNYIKFQLVQDRCSIIDNVEEGENINVYFDLRGREWNEKYFTNLNAWKVDKLESQNANLPQEDFPTSSDEPPEIEESDDLPF